MLDLKHVRRTSLGGNDLAEGPCARALTDSQDRFKAEHVAVAVAVAVADNDHLNDQVNVYARRRTPPR